jgi:hypothetical protein
MLAADLLILGNVKKKKAAIHAIPLLKGNVYCKLS